MAHIVVYLQRTPRGLHPGSVLALCLGREVGDLRGASVLGLCLGDAGAFDDRLIVEASRAGADQVVFLGPEGIQKLFRRLAPRHVLAPYTREAGSVLAQAGIGPMVGRWFGGPPEQVNKLETVIGVVAGSLCWQQAPLQIEPEYEADVTQVELAPWLAAAVEQVDDLSRLSRLSRTIEPPPLLYVSNAELDAPTTAALAQLGAHAGQIVDYTKGAATGPGTLLWFDGAGEGLPLTLLERGPELRVILLPGPRAISGPIDSSWGMADFVIPGEWRELVEEFNGPAWKSMFV